MDQKTSVKKILVPIAHGSEEIEAVCIIDTLRRAGAEVIVASVENELKVVASRKTKIEADTFLKNCVNELYDGIFLPGGTGAEHLRDCPDLINMLKNQAKRGGWYGAICASPAVVLEHHGLLNHRLATSHPNFHKFLKNQQSAHHRVVIDQNCVTSQSPGTALEYSLKLVECLYGEEKMKEINAPMGVVFPPQQNKL